MFHLQLADAICLLTGAFARDLRHELLQPAATTAAASTAATSVAEGSDRDGAADVHGDDDERDSERVALIEGRSPLAVLLAGFIGAVDALKPEVSDAAMNAICFLFKYLQTYVFYAFVQFATLL